MPLLQQKNDAKLEWGKIQSLKSHLFDELSKYATHEPVARFEKTLTSEINASAEEAAEAEEEVEVPDGVGQRLLVAWEVARRHISLLDKTAGNETVREFERLLTGLAERQSCIQMTEITRK
jgi:hypothetical protein